jgi:hypothetical protein
MDENFVSNRIDQSLPYVKKVAVEILSKPYNNSNEAMAAIASGIPDYYAKNYPQVAKEKSTAITKAVTEVQKFYTKNFFPKMKVYFPGCFRCHDGKHKSRDGRIIPKDCNLCHTVISQKQENIPPGTQVKNFVHPVDIGADLYKTNCSDCHMAAGQEVMAAGQEAMKH